MVVVGGSTVPSYLLFAHQPDTSGTTLTLGSPGAYNTSRNIVYIVESSSSSSVVVVGSSSSSSSSSLWLHSQYKVIVGDVFL